MAQCARCGAELEREGAACPRCAAAEADAGVPPVVDAPPVAGPPVYGMEQGYAPAPVPQQQDEFLATMVPYKNASALTAYYLAVFSLIPCVGIVLGIAAFVLGLRGLAYAKEHPEAKGRAHAWVGVLLGGLCGFGWLIALVVVLVMMAMTRPS